MTRPSARKRARRSLAAHFGPVTPLDAKMVEKSDKRVNKKSAASMSLSPLDVGVIVGAASGGASSHLPPPQQATSAIDSSDATAAPDASAVLLFYWRSNCALLERRTQRQN